MEAPEPVGESLALEFEPLGSLETFPEHRVIPFADGPADGPPDLQVNRRPPAAGLFKAAGRRVARQTLVARLPIQAPGSGLWAAADADPPGA
jgi:hypothetical protein